MQSGYGIAFDGKGLRSFNDVFPRNVKIFGVDNSSLSHTDNLRNDFLILLMEALVHQKKKYSL